MTRILILTLFFHAVLSYTVIIDYTEIERKMNASNLNAVLLISQYNNCPKCLPAEKILKNLDEFGKHYMQFFILYCDNLPRNLLYDQQEKPFNQEQTQESRKNNTTSITHNILRNLIQKKCISPFLTMVSPDLILLSPVFVQLEKGNIRAMPPRVTQFDQEFTFEEIVHFFSLHSSSFVEEIKTEIDLNRLLIPSQKPTLLSFSDTDSSSFIWRGFSSYFWGKLNFAWVPKTNTKVRKVFLDNDQILPSYHAIVEGRVLNFSGSHNFTSILDFIEEITLQKLPLLDSLVLENQYEFFSDYCQDCRNLRNVKQMKSSYKSPLPSYQLFWDKANELTNQASQLISSETLQEVLAFHSNTPSVLKQPFPKRTNSRQHQHANNSNNYFVQKEVSSSCPTSLFSQNAEELKEKYSQNQQILEDTCDQQNHYSDASIPQTPTVFNRFTLFRGYEEFTKWESLQENLKIVPNLSFIEFEEIDCRSKECTIWARNTYSTRYIPFVLFESSLTIKPILIDNGKEIMEIYNAISLFLALPQPQKILELNSTDAKEFCNGIMYFKTAICAIHLGNNLPVQFALLSQLNHNQTIFVHVKEPTQEFLARLKVTNNTFVLINNIAHLTWTSYSFPFIDSLTYYAQIITTLEEALDYNVIPFTSMEQLTRTNNSLVQIVISCESKSHCKRISFAVKSALHDLHYLSHTTIYIDMQELLISSNRSTSSLKAAYVIIDAKYYTQIYLSSYLTESKLQDAIIEAKNQLILALSFQTIYEKFS